MNRTLKSYEEEMMELYYFDSGEEGVALKAAIISSIVACSGLNKLPPSAQTERVFRVSEHKNDEQKNYMKKPLLKMELLILKVL